MTAVRLKGFGGMVPAVDDRLLGDNQAARSEDAWLYSGALIGLPVLTELHECTGGTTKAYRIPASYSEPQEFGDSLWLEFQNPNTDVIRAPVVDDTFDRYYWATTNDVPRYNTRARIEYNDAPVSNTITTTFGSDLVNFTTHPFEIGDAVTFTTSAADLPAPLLIATTYYVSADTFGANSFKLSTTLNGAINSTGTVNIADDGTGTHTIHSGTHAAWKLGVPAPSGAPTVIVTGGAVPLTTRSYVCTYVTAYGEEGPPSAPVTETGNISGSWDLTLPTPDSNLLGVDRYCTLVRIYRTVTSTAGVATYFFVAQQNINDTTYSDTIADAVVSANDQLQSTQWAPPPTDLEGWVLMPNGFLVGWRENEIWFSEPYRPHAWNGLYTLAIEYPVIGLGTISQTLVICSGGFPMTGTGVHPDSFSTSKMANFEPCVSRGSIISAPEGVYYASVAGLVKVVPGKAENITRNLITKDRWQTITQVTRLRLARLGTALYGFGTTGGGAPFDGDVFDIDDQDAFDDEDITGSLFGILLEVTNERVALNLLGGDEQTANVFNDPWTGELFLIRDDTVLWLDQLNPEPVYEPYLWRSKIFQFENKQNFGALKVYFEVPANTTLLNPVRDNTLVQTLSADQYGLVRIYADGVHVSTHELRTSGELMRPPGGFKADFWQFEIEARVRVFSFQVASSAKELKSV
jgi:hypothetical protein